MKLARAAPWLMVALLLAGGLGADTDPEAFRDVLAEHGFAVTGGSAPGFIEDRACSAGGCHAELCREFEATDTARSFVCPWAELFVSAALESAFGAALAVVPGDGR